MVSSTKHRLIDFETRRIRLREIEESDFLYLFRWRNSAKFRFLLHHNTEVISYKEFVQEFAMDSAGREFQYIVEKKQTDSPIGITYVDTFSQAYKSCFTNLFIDSSYESKGYGTDAFVLFMLFLFSHTSLEKIYANAFDFNTPSVSFMRNIGMKELQGNLTRVAQRGNLLCFAADRSIISNLARIRKILSDNEISKIKTTEHEKENQKTESLQKDDCKSHSIRNEPVGWR